jgi:hypothetical protein
MYLWHGAIRNAVKRGTKMPEVNYLDLGPSKKDDIAAAKAKFGFDDTNEWQHMCDYTGDFVTPVKLG